MSDVDERSDAMLGSQPVMATVNSDEAALRIIVRQQRKEIERLKEAIRRVAEQDATLSVQGGNVTVTMDATLTDDERLATEPSPASAGSQPACWAADIPGKFGAAPTMLFGYTEKLVRSMASAGGDLVKPFPLYRQPQPALTDEEHLALCRARDAYAANSDDEECVEIAIAIRGLLERLG